MRTRGGFSKLMLGLGFAFLYVPILCMIVFSFNDSRSVTVWNSITPRGSPLICGAARSPIRECAGDSAVDTDTTARSSVRQRAQRWRNHSRDPRAARAAR